MCRAVSVVYGSGDYGVVRPRSSPAMSTSRSRRPTASRCSGGRARARRRCCTSSAAWSSRPSGTVEWQGQPLSSLDAAARGALRAHGIAYVFQGANLLAALHRLRERRLRHRCWPESGQIPSWLLSVCSRSSAWATRPTACRPSSREARPSASRSPARSPSGPSCCSATSRPGHLDTDTGERVLDLIEALRQQFGFALVVATHDVDVAARFPRQVELHDGCVVREEAAV